jgi:hypothetical protein
MRRLAGITLAELCEDLFCLAPRWSRQDKWPGHAEYESTIGLDRFALPKQHIDPACMRQHSVLCVVTGLRRGAEEVECNGVEDRRG